MDCVATLASIEAWLSMYVDMCCLKPQVSFCNKCCAKMEPTIFPSYMLCC